MGGWGSTASAESRAGSCIGSWQRRVCAMDAGLKGLDSSSLNFFCVATTPSHGSSLCANVRQHWQPAQPLLRMACSCRAVAKPTRGAAPAPTNLQQAGVAAAAPHLSPAHPPGRHGAARARG